MRRFTLAVLAAGAAALLLRCSGASDPVPVITRTASSVDGFELRHIGFGNARLHPGNFSLGYAIRAGYPYLVYRGEVYRRAGEGSVFVFPARGLKPRYFVEETPVELGRDGDVASELVVSDTAKGEVMARRRLRMGQSEDGHGWAGQHAITFLGKVLPPAVPATSFAERNPARIVTAHFDVLEEGVPAPPQRTGVDCPATWAVDPMRSRAALDSGAWVFVPRSSLNSFACRGDLVLVESGNGFELSLDLLTTAGEHLFGIGLRGELDLYAKNALTRFQLANGELRVEFVHAPFRERGKPAPPARLLRTTIALPPGVTQALSGKLAVK